MRRRRRRRRFATSFDTERMVGNIGWLNNFMLNISAVHRGTLKTLPR